MKPKMILTLGGITLFLAVLLGAFGAHGLKEILDIKAMSTFKTGVTYQFYHGLGLLALGLTSKVLDIRLEKSAFLFILGICLFSFNCYLYAFTQIKVIAMIIPLGGLSFIFGWIFFIIAVSKSEKI